MEKEGSSRLRRIAMKEEEVEPLEFIEEMTSHVDEVQQMVLDDILSTNVNVEYLQRHGIFGRSIDRKTFKSKLPIIEYEDILPDIQRIANGDPSPIFSAQPISELLTRNISGLDKGKVLFFFLTRTETKSPAGIIMRSVLTSYYKSPQFLCKHYDNINYTSSIPSIHCTDVFQSLYAQMLAGLADRLAIFQIGTTFAPIFLQAIHFLKRHYQELAADIEHGTVNPQVTDAAVRAALGNALTPDPENAEHIRKECSSRDFQGIIRRIWPNTKFLDVIVTGPMAQYIPSLNFYSGDLPLTSTPYGSSECFFGLNLYPLTKPEDVAYTIMPNMAYFEFLPVKSADDIGRITAMQVVDPVDLAHVEDGKEYELIVTTYSGLYRYKIGDVLRVAKFYNKAPQFHIVGRKNVCLSIDIDKTEETELQRAIAAAELAHLRPHNARVLDYICYTDVKTIPGHYVIYCELSPINHSDNSSFSRVIDQCCLTIEQSLNYVYRGLRSYDKTIGPLEIKLVKGGTFHEVMDHAIARGASAAQYKPPKCVKSTWMLDILEARVVSTHFSPGVPSWLP
ncbi:indole-3-acetic acid-amido synthetase GH3.8-like isoform X2 [Nymphaea colorata]|uniref:indole-3-acetic acid-amido synthetase GH3.8-like isoform X2 n=1 Tax=Nymphaea colorata TaxID=210225 RepID=UPI00129D8FB3|nr:indole-3-acetic acid-amido synthetase GH3.8-like isoform X2 [Nymphaea colorata]